MEKIKVLHFIWSVNLGGIERQVMNLCLTQIKSGRITSHILIGSRKGLLMKELERLNIPHTFAGLKSGFDFNRRSFSFTKNLMKQYDIIHIHTYNPVIVTASILSGKKIIYTIHGNFQFGRKNTWRIWFNNLLRKYFLNYYCDIITFNSEWTKKIATERFGLKKNEKYVIYNGINLEEDVTAAEPIKEEFRQSMECKFVVGFIGRFHRSKRIDRLIEAFGIFSAGKNDTRLLIVGDGDDRQLFESMVREQGIADDTIFTGFQQFVKSYQHWMDVCVFPASDEAFGLVAAEALAMGKPTIIFNDAGGMLEIFRGKFQEDITSSPVEMASRINYYYSIRNNDSTESILERKAVAKMFSLETMEEKFHQLYVKLRTGRGKN